MDFSNSTILLCFFLCFLMNDLYFLIIAINDQIFDPIPELAILHEHELI